jgi:hypothetical protein
MIYEAWSNTVDLSKLQVLEIGPGRASDLRFAATKIKFECLKTLVLELKHISIRRELLADYENTVAEFLS